MRDFLALCYVFQYYWKFSQWKCTHGSCDTKKKGKQEERRKADRPDQGDFILSEVTWEPLLLNQPFLRLPAPRLRNHQGLKHSPTFSIMAFSSQTCISETSTDHSHKQPASLKIQRCVYMGAHTHIHMNPQDMCTINTPPVDHIPRCAHNSNTNHSRP